MSFETFKVTDVLSEEVTLSKYLFPFWKRVYSKRKYFVPIPYKNQTGSHKSCLSYENGGKFIKCRDST